MAYTLQSTLPYLVVLLFYVCIFSLVTRSHGCGVATHMEIGHIAAVFLGQERTIAASSDVNITQFERLIWKHQDAFQAGNTYPDTYYSSACLQGRYHQVSEDTHWTPFTNITIQYIRDNLPLPWDDEAEKLIVFMLGFISHQVADISWHSLGVDQGFIQTMSYMDFHSDYGTAHTTADFGADVLNEYRGRYSYYSAEQWYIPVYHLTKIYQLYYHHTATPATVITADVIEQCTSLIYLAVLGEMLAVSELYPHTVSKSPFLAQQLDDYYLGGMYDMALWTTKIWSNALYILQNGFSQECTTPENPLYIRCNYSQPLTEYGLHGGALKPNEQLMTHRLPADSLLKIRTKHGVILRLRGGVYRRKSKMKQKLLSSASAKSMNRTGAAAVHTRLSTDVPYAQLSRAMVSADINGDGYDDLMVSAPQYVRGQTSADHLSAGCVADRQGAVFIVLGSAGGLPSGDLKIEQVANHTLYGIHCQTGRFGQALAVLDTDLDGRLDLVVAAPQAGWDGLNYTGQIVIYRGRNSSRSLFYENPQAIPVARNVINFGSKLFTSDIDLDGHSDLVIGSPLSTVDGANQAGIICVMYSRKMLDASNMTCFSSAKGGQAAYSWFGSSVASTRTAVLGPVLIVGAPAFRKCHLQSCEYHVDDIQTAGQVSVWSRPHLKLLMTLEGSTNHQHLGSSLSVSQADNMLIVGADSADVEGRMTGIPVSLRQAGAVFLYKLADFVLPMTSVRPVSSWYNDREFSMFGHNVLVEDFDSDGSNDLFITAQQYTEDFTEEIYSGEQGRLLVFKSLSKLPTNDTGSDLCGQSLIQPCPDKLADYSLVGPEARSQFSSSMTFVKFRTKSTHFHTTKVHPAGYLAVGAIRSSGGGGRRSGAVYIYQMF